MVAVLREAMLPLEAVLAHSWINVGLSPAYHYLLLDCTISTMSAGLDAPVHPEGRTLLHLAAWQGKAEACEKLVAAGTKLNPRDNSNSTPLALACLQGHTATAKALVGLGADLEARDNYQCTPLLCAVHAGRKDAAVMLCEA